MFETLSDRFEGVLGRLRSKGRLTEADVDEALREIRRALLEADVNFTVVKGFVERVRERCVGEELSGALNPGQQVVKIVNEELTATLGGETIKITFSSKPPTVVLMAGLQGSGKTTNSAKLASWFKRQGRHPLLVGADLQRPAAVEQLRTLGRQIEVPVWSEDTDPVAVASGAVAEARRTGRDVVIVDTAGRLAIDADLMDEVRRISGAVSPDYTFLVIDAMTGQDAVATAEAFHATLELDGVILTKLDGDARGGAALSVKEVVGRPIAFASTGEKIKDFDLFHPDRLAGRILGMGDMLTLIEKAEEVFEQDQAEEAATKLLEGQFTFDDFLDQMQQLKKMGPLSGLLGMMPGVPKEVRNAEIDDREIARIEAIIRSMTTTERVDPDLIDASRRERIARGSGTDPHQVSELVKQFKEVSKMMKRMGGMGSKKVAKSRRKAAKGKKGKGPGGRTSGGRVAPKTKAPLRLPDLDPASLQQGGGAFPGLGGPGGGGGLPDLGAGPPRRKKG
ncbi:signal recognition particle protein [Rhabdothermincola salaria]|uniref:signal recognition particle protein n=1 Tax=Rhabdothermincola salaria TaxID=2903142 RepID=UPI001E374ABC|nr:signal recognition particle protein [Rhabdothermincola salaria]MCD9624943.1 signal recognition particle protein [Rhabdothermincola salaria]